MDVFYFKARYIFEDDGYEEHEQYGFLVAENFNKAMDRIVDYFGTELISVEITCIGDTGLISVEDEKIARAFKKAYNKTHYGEDEE